MDDDDRRHGSSHHYPQPPFHAEQKQKKPGLESKMTPRPRYEGKLYKPAGKLRGQVALVTGGDSGIGRAVAVLYAREGADVAIVYLPEEQSDAQETQSAIEEAGRRCLLLPGDVGDPQFCKEAVELTVRELGGLHVLVNNAAYQESQEKIERISDEQWDRTFRTNIYGYFYMARAALRHMKDGAAIVNCGSVVSSRGSEKLLDYSSTKGAIAAFTKSLAQNLVDRRIRVNCVAPGPMERPAQPEEIAPAFVFFASEADSGYCTGQTLPLTGGEIVGS